MTPAPKEMPAAHAERKALPPLPSRVISGGFHKLLEANPASISLAIRPMESLYTYQVVALANAFAYLRANQSARLRLDVADLEFDMQRGRDFLPYSRNPASMATAQKIEQLTQTFSGMYASVRGRIFVRRFSEWLSQDPGLMSHVLKLFEEKRARLAKQLVSKKTGKVFHLPVTPICPSCDHASASFGVINQRRTILSSTCNHTGCKNVGKDFSVELRAPGSFCLFYFFDSLADAYKDPVFGRADVHLLGINPTRKWSNGMDIVDVISRLTALLTDDDYSPKYYPLLRLEEPCSLRRKSVFDRFLDNYLVSAKSALEVFMAFAETFDLPRCGHINMAYLHAVLAGFLPTPKQP